MSKKNSRKESIINLYCKLFPEKLNKVLEVNLKSENIILERSFGERRVDITTIDDDGKRYYIEVLLKKADDEHYNQIKKLIEDISNPREESVIILIATEVQQSYIQELFKLVAVTSYKNLTVNIVKINEIVIPILEEINKVNILNQVEMLNKVNAIEPLFTLINGIKSFGNKHTVSAKAFDKDESIKYTKKQILLVSVIKFLRSDFLIHPNLHHFKKVINGNYISIGSGINTAIEYRIVYNRSNNMGVELCFGSNQKAIYYKMLSKQEMIEESLDYIPLVWNKKNEKIGWYIGNTYGYNEEQIVKRLGRMTKKYICALDKYIRQSIDNQ